MIHPVERGLHWTVSLFHSIAAFFFAYRASEQLRPWLGHFLLSSPYGTKFIADHQRRVDFSDAEWVFYRESMLEIGSILVIHSALFRLVPRYLELGKAQIILPIFWLGMQVWLVGLVCVSLVSVQAVLSVLVSVRSRQPALAWIICISCVLLTHRLAPFALSPTVRYRQFNVYLYSAVQTVNMSIWLCRNTSATLREQWLSLVHYFFYPPYKVSLIVLYDDFVQQFNLSKQRRQSSSSKQDLRRFFIGLCRLIASVALYDLLRHFVYVNAIYASPSRLIDSLHGYSVFAVSYVVGQLFHVKYVVIFGLPALFAQMDGMEPPGLPICISRVSKYSQMWRQFDRGLYQFLKRQVYLPMMGADFSPLRRLMAMVVAFMFVVAWHGTALNYICWVSLSALELCIERIGNGIVQSTRFRQLSMGTQRRLTALAMLTTVIPGIFGVFFFLGEGNVGFVVFRRILVDGARDILTANISITAGGSAGLVLVHLLLIGYCFNHVCLDLERTERKRRND